MSFKNFIYPPLMHQTSSFGSLEIEKILDTTLTKDNGRLYKVKWVKISWEAESDLSLFGNVINDFWSQYARESLLVDNRAGGFSNSPSQLECTEETNVPGTQSADVEYDFRKHFDDVSLIHDHNKDIDLHTNPLAYFKDHFEKAFQDNYVKSASYENLLLLAEKTSEGKGSGTTIKDTSETSILVSGETLQEDIAEAHKSSQTCKENETSVIKETARNTNNLQTNKKFSCEKCDKSFSVEEKLEKHAVMHLLTKCEVCDKQFSRLSHLQKHRLIHTNERPYSCRKCGKSFNDKSSLKQHEQIHSNVRNFFCEICEKKFQRAQHLKRHEEMVHKKLKRFSCHLCEKKFYQKIALVAHLNVHTGQKPFACDICNKDFRDRSTLARHKNTHTGEKNFSCKECGKAFTRLSTLKNHYVSIRHNTKMHVENEDYQANKTCSK